jgi:hypothetical protein
MRGSANISHSVPCAGFLHPSTYSVAANAKVAIAEPGCLLWSNDWLLCVPVVNLQAAVCKDGVTTVKRTAVCPAWQWLRQLLCRQRSTYQDKVIAKPLVLLEGQRLLARHSGNRGRSCSSCGGHHPETAA